MGKKARLKRTIDRCCIRHLESLKHTFRTLDDKQRQAKDFHAAIRRCVSSEMLTLEDLESAFLSREWWHGYSLIRQRVWVRFVSKYGVEPFRLELPPPSDPPKTSRGFDLR